MGKLVGGWVGNGNGSADICGDIYFGAADDLDGHQVLEHHVLEAAAELHVGREERGRCLGGKE